MSPVDLDDPALMDALRETQVLGHLGMRSTGRAPVVQPPSPWTATELTAPSGAPGQFISGADGLALDGSRKATIAGRVFTLTEKELTRVIKVIEIAYKRAMKDELAKIRRSVLGQPALMHPLPQPTDGADTSPEPSDVRLLPRTRAKEITYTDATPEGGLPELRAFFGEEDEVQLVPSPDAGEPVAASSPRPSLPRRAAPARGAGGKPVPSDGSQPSSVAEGRPALTGGQIT